MDEVTNETRWNGLVGMLAEGKADLSSCGLTASKERAMVKLDSFPFIVVLSIQLSLDSQAIDFSVNIFDYVVTFMMQNPNFNGGASQIDLLAYMGIFSINVWVLICLTWLVVTLAATTYQYWSPNYVNTSLYQYWVNR